MAQAGDEHGERARPRPPARARRAGPRASCATSGRSASAPIGPSSGPGDEHEVPARVAPGQRDPAGRRAAAKRSASPSEMFASGKKRRPRRRTRAPARGNGERRARRRRRSRPERPAGRVERAAPQATQPVQTRGERAGGRRAPRPACAGRALRPARRLRHARPARAGACACARLVAAGSAASCGRRRPARPGRGRARAAIARVERAGQVGPDGLERGAPAWIRRDGLGGVARRGTGWRPASASQSITPTAQTSAAAVACFAVEPLGRDVGERPGHVADRGQRVELRHLREPEVEQAHVDARRPSPSRTFDGFTSRWTIPRPCACASASSTCAATSTASRSPSSPAASAWRSVRPGTYS